MKPRLTVDLLSQEAGRFVAEATPFVDKSLYGVTDGKAIGTYLERRFHAFLSKSYDHVQGKASKGRDLPDLNVDLKITSARQPQSSCPYRSANQKVYGLGYGLLIFVYDKHDDDQENAGVLKILDAVFVEEGRTADFQTTIGLRDLVAHNATIDDIVDFLNDRKLPVDDEEAKRLATKIVRSPPEIGYLTISNALQWRLQYGRVVDQAGKVDGLRRLAPQLD